MPAHIQQLVLSLALTLGCLTLTTTAAAAALQRPQPSTARQAMLEAEGASAKCEVTGLRGRVLHISGRWPSIWAEA